MGRELFNEYRKARSFEHGGPPPHPGEEGFVGEISFGEANNENVTEEVTSEEPELFTGDWTTHHAANWKGAFPRMYYTNRDNNPNLKLSKAGFLALAMSKHFGFDKGQPIHLTSGERLGYDQWRVMKQYQYPQDMSLYNRSFRQVVKDSVETYGFNTPESDTEVINWIEQQYSDFENGLITEKELKKKVGSHIVGDAGDFVGPYRQWLKSGRSKSFRKAFNINALDEGDHFHVPFFDIDATDMTESQRASYYHFESMFDQLATENERGELRIDMNPHSYTLNQLSGMGNLELPMIEINQIESNWKSDIPTIIQKVEMPEKIEYSKPSLRDRLGLKHGGNPEWLKRAKAEYGRLTETPVVDQRELQANVQEIASTGVPIGDPIPGQDYSYYGTVDPDYQEPIVQDDVTNFTVNSNGWANIEAYREKKEDGQFIMNTQNKLIESGWDGLVADGVWGNKTYTAINQSLVNTQLDNYTYPNFTKGQFLDQVYKESHGKNSKVSPRGAMGISQFMPKTFKWMKEKGWIPETAKITDPAAQSLAQRRYMDYIYEDRANVKSAKTTTERQARAFAAYNMGPGAFDKFWSGLTDKEKKGGWETWYKKANKETSLYVLWMMDKSTYKKLYDKPEKRGKIITSKWNDVYYGYESWKKSNPTYRY